MKRVFIGSSSEALDKVYVVKSMLDSLGAAADCWNTVFIPGHNTIDVLIQAAHEYDAGVFIFNKDDQVVSRNGTKKSIPRDNVIAEAGMFSSVLGKESVALCIVPGVHEISDFKGITYLNYDPSHLDVLKKGLENWLHFNVKEHKHLLEDAKNNNIFMSARHEIHKLYSLDSRLHISDGLYKQISHIRIMNLASNLIINPAVGDAGQVVADGMSLSSSIETIMRETTARIELILAEPNKYNLNDIETKIANHKAGSSAGAVYSAIETLYDNLSTDTIYARRYASMPILFQAYLMKISMPFAIFNVEFLGEADKFSHVKVDLYSSVLDTEDSRRCFIVWKNKDLDNYNFFVNNFNSSKINNNVCERATLDTLKKWKEKWQKN